MENTNYYIVRRQAFEDIKITLQKAKITALIADEPLSKHEDRWVVIEAPRTLGCKVPGDYSTFSVLSDPWLLLTEVFPVIVELFVSEGQIDWSLKCWSEGQEKFYQFIDGKQTFVPSENDCKFLSSIFSTPFDSLSRVLKPRMAFDFCQLIASPYFEMEMQDSLQNVIPAGRVIFSSELED